MTTRNSKLATLFCLLLFFAIGNSQFAMSQTQYVEIDMFRAGGKAPMEGATVYLVPVQYTYPGGALLMTANTIRIGTYYRTAVPTGSYNVWVNQAKYNPAGATVVSGYVKYRDSLNVGGGSGTTSHNYYGFAADGVTTVLNADSTISVSPTLRDSIHNAFVQTSNDSLIHRVRPEGSSLTAFGNSIIEGTYNTTALRIANRVASSRAWTLRNAALTSTQLIDGGQIDSMYQTTVSSLNNFMILSGYNDVRYYGDSTQGKAMYRTALTAAAAWLTIPSTKKYTSRSDSVTYTGTWANSIVYGGSFGKECVSGSGTVTARVYGTTVYVGMSALTSSNGDFTVSIDGISYGTFTPPSGVTTYIGRAYYPYMVRIPGLKSGKHTVVVSRGASGTTFFDWVGGNEPSSAGSPTFYVGNCLRMKPYGYALGSPDYNHGSDTAVANFNAIISKVCSDLASDGLNVVYVDASAYFDPLIPTNLVSDSVHPSDTGAAFIANAYLDAMNGFTKPSERQAAKLLDRMVFIDDTIKVKGYLRSVNDNLNPNTFVVSDTGSVSYRGDGTMKIKQFVTGVNALSAGRSSWSGTGTRKAIYVPGSSSSDVVIVCLYGGDGTGTNPNDLPSVISATDSIIVMRAASGTADKPFNWWKVKTE